MTLHQPHCGRSRLSSEWPALGDQPGARLPFAGIDRIDDAPIALALIAGVASTPHTYETIVILLDHEHRGLTIMTFDATLDNDSVLNVADRITEYAHRIDDLGAAIVASFRPGGCDEPADIDRWLTIDEELGLVGVELVEWFVIGNSVSCPRSLLGDAPRWAA